jgi:hypothetical protein
VNGGLVWPSTGLVGVRWNDIEPVDQAGIDLRVKLLPEISRERLDHVGRTGAAVPHVNAGELDAALVFAIGDRPEHEYRPLEHGRKERVEPARMGARQLLAPSIRERKRAVSAMTGWAA